MQAEKIVALQPMAENDEEIPAPKTFKQQLWNAAKLVLKITITSALLYWVYTKVDFSKVKFRLLHANYWWMLVAVLCYLCSMLASSWRLLSFFKSINLKLNPWYNLRLYFLGLFYNMLLPGGIGGDGYKIFILNKAHKVPGKKLFWAIMFDRLSGLWAIGLITVGLIFLIPQIDIHMAVPLSIFLVGSAVYYFVAYKFFREYTRFFFQAHLKALIVQGMQLLAIICVMIGQDFSGKYSPYLLSFLISALASILPITVGGAGAREAIFTKLSDIFPMDKGLAVFLPSSFYLISLLVALFGLYYVIRPNRLEKWLDNSPSAIEPVEDEKPGAEN